MNDRMKILTSIPPKKLTITAIGAFLGIATATLLAFYASVPLLLASLGSSAALVYGAPDSPAAQPKRVIFGQFISALVSISVCQILGFTWYSVAIAVALSVVAMLLTDTFHPPGSATAFTCVIVEANFAFAFVPVLLGSVILVLWGLIIKRVTASLENKKTGNENAANENIIDGTTTSENIINETAANGK
ncbi:hypothetical protein MsAg5_18340 [Methanosarcinaceae archaeon Ag5]|uniref:HPP transmembrane region domain-containing protein n=1 Tax=Methanolapillus africanus TaxID=3028297 RepID=A0AAE4MLK0_9EURY|nr:hypothetical protein [Methanosarcinaceae archaeon Ag5]